MTHKILIAGFGGQGVMLMGQLLGYSACAAGKQVSFFPAYGAEQRGGTANCTVVISDEEVGAPNPRTLDTLVIMNEPSLSKFRGRLKPGGNLILNADLVKSEVTDTDAKVYRIPIVSMARELGNARVANVMMAGAIIEITGVLEEDVVAAVAAQKLGKTEELAELNKRALAEGIAFGRRCGTAEESKA
ncbi:MAG: 2-oxoacid:acceptor oxidoreductase family protein [Oscillospiraceae bacterium]|nr:2-oxoacid:acceptor oxidoreductase family protein [Oscillospiraceae bacterium]MBR3185279.1 2-oxoacid:acceptor oxidoreductase family protein [Oscillospiraceae bacterium]